jgi:hypothetical protein
VVVEVEQWYGGGADNEGGVDTKTLKEDVVAVEVACMLCKADGESETYSDSDI